MKTIHSERTSLEVFCPFTYIFIFFQKPSFTFEITYIICYDVKSKHRSISYSQKIQNHDVHCDGTGCWLCSWFQPLTSVTAWMGHRTLQICRICCTVKMELYVCSATLWRAATNFLGCTQQETVVRCLLSFSWYTCVHACTPTHNSFEFKDVTANAYSWQPMCHNTSCNIMLYSLLSFWMPLTPEKPSSLYEDGLISQPVSLKCLTPWQWCW